MATPKELMIGRKSVCDAFDINKEQFYLFISLGMPMRKISGRWYGHKENISDFFKRITIGPPIDPSSDRIRNMMEDDFE